VVTDAYDLVGWLWDRVEKFPRNTKPVLGRQVEEASLELLLVLVRATYLRHRGRIPKVQWRRPQIGD